MLHTRDACYRITLASPIEIDILKEAFDSMCTEVTVAGAMPVAES